jgi:hypothetical protein
MTRRLASANDAPGDATTKDAIPLVGVIKNTLRRMQSAAAARQLPNFADASVQLADAERDGLTTDASGRFARAEIRRRWPSPYGGRGGVASRSWEKHIVQILAGKFVRERRNMPREDLREWVEAAIRERNEKARKDRGEQQTNVSFRDPERWTKYVRRAISQAVIDILLRRQCRCAGDSAINECTEHFGRRFCLSRDEGAAMLVNVWSWRADGPLPPGG